MDEITGLERAAAAHWRGTDEEWLGDWLLRAAEGFTGRANSVLPLGDPGVPLDDALDKVTGWYRARDLPALISVPMPLEGTCALDGELAGRGWGLRSGPAFVMTADLPLPDTSAPAGELRVDETPDAEWLRARGYLSRAARARYDGGSGHRARIGGLRGPGGMGGGSPAMPGKVVPPASYEVLTSARSQAFVSIRDGQAAVAVARLSVAEGWAGISSVEVDRAHRRRGLGAAITAACCAEALRRGVNRVFLQVETGNDAARALYARCGFRYSHRYHYRLEPGTAAF